MTKKIPSDPILTRFLLGALPEEERLELEESLLADEGLFEETLAMEGELLDSYVRGELSRRDNRRVERHLLQSSEQRSRMAFAAALRKVAEEHARARRPRDLRPTGSWWRGIQDLFRFHPAPAMAWALAATLILAAGAAWFYLHSMGLERELQALAAQRDVLAREAAELERRQAQLEAQLEQEEHRKAELQAELTGVKRTLAQVEEELTRQQTTPPRPLTLSFVLSMAVRGAGAGQVLTVPSQAEAVEFQLDLEGALNYPHFRAVLRTARGDQIWSRTGLVPQTTEWGRLMTLTLPASLLPPGRYQLTLEGLTSEGQPELVGFYEFQIQQG